MKNKKSWMGILVLVLVLVFGMMVVGCDDGSKGSDDDVSDSSGTHTHSYYWTGNASTHWQKCSICGIQGGAPQGMHSYTYYPSLGYNDWPCTICKLSF